MEYAWQTQFSYALNLLTFFSGYMSLWNHIRRSFYSTFLGIFSISHSSLLSFFVDLSFVFCLALCLFLSFSVPLSVYFCLDFCLFLSRPISFFSIFSISSVHSLSVHFTWLIESISSPSTEIRLTRTNSVCVRSCEWRVENFNVHLNVSMKFICSQATNINFVSISITNTFTFYHPVWLLQSIKEIVESYYLTYSFKAFRYYSNQTQRSNATFFMTFCCIWSICIWKTSWKNSSKYLFTLDFV